MNIKQSLEQLARQAKGSFKTVHDRVVIIKRFGNYLKDNNIQIKHVDHIKTKHIEGYIQLRQTLGISKRTLQNEMSAIRKTFTQAGRDKLVYSERLSNKNLNIHDASRKGTKTAITDEQYQTILQSAIQKDEGLAVTIRLARVLGLRGEEAVQSTQSLKTWQTAINDGKEKLRIVFGTKGNRPRDTLILNREQVK